jgi:hypothetical protein
VCAAHEGLSVPPHARVDGDVAVEQRGLGEERLDHEQAGERLADECGLGGDAVLGGDQRLQLVAQEGAEAIGAAGARPSRNVTVARSYCSCDGVGRIARISSSEPAVTSTRVRAGDGIRTTVYVITIRSVVDLARARREQWRVVRHAASGTWRDFLTTPIRHGLCFRMLPRDPGPLVLSMIAAALVASLMLGIRHAPERSLRRPSTRAAAVPLPR